MNKKITFDVPTSWSHYFLDSLRQHQLENDVDFVIYGALPKVFGTGRPDDVPHIDESTVERHFESAHDYKIKTNYLLNSKNSIEDFCRNSDYHYEFINWVANKLRADFITVSDVRNVNFLFNSFGYNNFYISAIAGLSDIKSIKSFLSQLKSKYVVKYIVLHHKATISKTRNLAEINNYCQDIGITPILMVTESCFESCTVRDSHYRLLSGGDKLINGIDPYQVGCILKRIYNPASLFDLTGFLLPEELSYISEKTGMSTFKITGRSKSQNWLINTITSYIKAKSPENLFEIIVFTAPELISEFGTDISALFYLNSKEYLNARLELREMNASERVKHYTYLAEDFLCRGLLKLPNTNETMKNDLANEYQQYLLDKITTSEKGFSLSRMVNKVIQA